ncbi:unnamed protein product, partial [Ectocarpus sp. 8 AP-2014]
RVYRKFPSQTSIAGAAHYLRGARGRPRQETTTFVIVFYFNASLPGVGEFRGAFRRGRCVLLRRPEARRQPHGREGTVRVYSFVRFDFFTSVQQGVQLHLRFSVAQAMEKLSDVMELGA